MVLHVKVPLFALLGLIHLGIPLLRAILDRIRGIDDCDIHDGPSARLQPLPRRILRDPRKELIAQLVSFQEMQRPADGGLIGHGLLDKIHPHKLPQSK